MKKTRLAATLKKLISDNGITMRQLSLKTGVPASTISALAAGRAAHKYEHLYALAEFFGVSFEFLIFGEDSKPSLERILEGALTESIYSGWLKVKIERVIPDKNEK